MEDERMLAERKEQFLKVTSEMFDVVGRLRRLGPTIPTLPPYWPDSPVGDPRVRKDGAPSWAHKLLDIIWDLLS